MQDKFKELVSNRKATFNYEILETYEAGIALTGTEVKSLKAGAASLQEAYIKTAEGQLWLIGCHISHYRFGNLHNHEEVRDRKLLMHKNEIIRLERYFQEKGGALIPLSFYLVKGHIKLRLARAVGKKTFDKRASIKERDEKKEISKALKNHP